MLLNRHRLFRFRCLERLNDYIKGKIVLICGISPITVNAQSSTAMMRLDFINPPCFFVLSTCRKNEKAWLSAYKKSSLKARGLIASSIPFLGRYFFLSVSYFPDGKTNIVLNPQKWADFSLGGSDGSTTSYPSWVPPFSDGISISVSSPFKLIFLLHSLQSAAVEVKRFYDSFLFLCRSKVSREVSFKLFLHRQLI